MNAYARQHSFPAAASPVPAVHARTLPAPTPSRLLNLMISESALIAMKGKLFLSCFAVAFFGLADMTVPPTSVEDYTLKGGLAGALGFTVRLLITTMREHKAELAALALQAKTERDAREKSYADSHSQVATALQSLTASTNEQTQYFRTLGQKLIERGLNHPTDHEG